MTTRLEPALGQFSTHKGKAVRAYEHQYVLDHIRDGSRGEFYKVEDQRFLGSEGFADGIQRESEKRLSMYMTSPYPISEVTLSSIPA